VEITDPFSGMTYTVTLYRQYKQLVYFVEQAWGCSVIKQEHIAILMG
jgi:hypothetical protein